MTLRALDIPDDEAQLAAWLDEQLAGHHLPELLTELQALRDLPLEAPPPADVRRWLGERLEAVLERGTGALETNQRRELLSRPGLLPALQELIDQAGGDYWNELAGRSAETAAALARGRERLAPVWLADAPRRSTASSPPPSPRSRRRSLAWAFAAIAATLVIGLIAFRPASPPTVAAWGWNAPHLFEGAPPSADYLRRLAEAGDEWNDERPETKTELVERIRAMRTGCQRLIDHQHVPLAPDQNDALKQLCRKWLGQFDQVLADLEQDRQTPREARDAMDAIVEKLVRRLNSGSLES